MKDKHTSLRLNDEDKKELKKAAKAAGVSESALLRTFMHEGLAGYDRRHEDLLQRIKSLEEHFSQVHELTAVVASLVAALDVQRKPDEKALEISDNLKQGFVISKAVLFGQKKGLFKNAGE